jgi:hypothetical protein
MSPATEGLLGAVLVVGGIAGAVYGFHRDNISAPSVNITNWSWNWYTIMTNWCDASGTVQNTGNVAISNIRVYITYRNSSGSVLGDYYGDAMNTNAGSAGIGGSAHWSTSNSVGYSVPYTASIHVEYQYTKLFKTKNPTVAWVGVAAAGVGAYLIWDAMYSGSYVKSALNKHGMEMELVSDLPNLYGGMKLTKIL